MLNKRKPFYGKNKGYLVDRNERMTAIAGAFLFVFIIVELVITANIHNLISEHIFVGVLLSGPLIVKMFSTGYRFFRYYTKSSTAFVRKGPPNILLRLLAPFLILITILVFISGFGLVFGGHAYKEIFFKIHAVSVTLWLPLLGVHIYAYIRKVPGLITKDFTKKPEYQVSGRGGRLGINVAALIVSGVAATVLTPWHAVGHGHGLPSPLVLGIVAAVIAVLVYIPILRITKNTSPLQ